MQSELELALSATAKSVFATMLQMSVTAEALEAATDLGPLLEIHVGIVGQFNAVLHLCTNARCARALAGSLFALPETMVESREMNDVLGELTNMHAGHLKSRLCERGLSCAITHPAVGDGGALRAPPTDGIQRHSVAIRCPNGELVLLVLAVKAPRASHASATLPA